MKCSICSREAYVSVLEARNIYEICRTDMINTIGTRIADEIIYALRDQRRHIQGGH